MVKELNNMKNKKSNSYKPYDTSNSFVRRVTSRVSQLLPQPSSWLSRFLSREPEEIGPVTFQEGDDEEIIPPPSKRQRTVQTCTDFPMYINNVGPSDHRRLDEKREEELSPIRNYKYPSPSGPSRSEDLNAPGPSGLSRHHRFVSSTPAAVLEAHSHQVQQSKVNGDDGSDSDSGSHASSLPPENQPSKSLFRTLNINKPRTPRRNAQEELNNSLLKSKQLKLDVSSSSLSSSRGRVSFDTTVFNSPFKGRLCGGLSISRDETIESPFYRSNTTFGGASSCNDSLLRTRSLHSEVPIVVQPSQPQRVSDNLGSSTKKILKALEQFSTPMLDQSRRLQARERGVKRKAEVPYKELVIPQMPDLLRIKRREARHIRQPVSASSPLTSNSTSTSLAVVPPTKSCVPEFVASKSSSSHLPQRISKLESSGKDRAITSVDKRPEDNKKVKESPALMTCLPVTSLPKFDTTLVKQQSTSLCLPTTSVPSTTKRSTIQFTFSKPIDVADKATTCSSIPPTKTFSQPLDPTTKEPEKKPVANCVNNSQPKGAEVMVYSPPSNLKLKKKAPIKKHVVSSPELKAGSVLDALSKSAVAAPSDLKSGSVLDILKKGQEPEKKPAGGTRWECQSCYVSNDDAKTKCAACEQPRKTSSSDDNSKGFGDKFKISSVEWECKGCLVRNKLSDNKCVACEQANPNIKGSNAVEPPKTGVSISSGFGDTFKPPPGSWECSVCLIQNKSGDLKCVSCSSDKPGAPQTSSVKTTAPLSNLFKKPAGSWECDACLVQNKSDATCCVSCCTNKPGTNPTQSGPSFSFGIPPVSTPSNFSFGVSSTSTSDSSVKPSTAFTSSLVPSTQSTTPTFTFGIPNSGQESKPTPVPIYNSVFPNLVNNVDNKDKTENPKTEADKPSEKVPKSEPLFTFGVPNKDAGVAAVVSSAKSIFGNVTTSSVGTPTTSSGSTVTTSATSTALPIFVNQISSTKSPIVSTEKTSAPTTHPMFTFGSSSTPISSFGKSGASENSPKTSVPLFGTSENEIKPMVTSPVPKVAPLSNSVVSSVKSTPEAKANIFTFGGSSSVEKKSFLNSVTEAPGAAAFSSNTINSFSTPNTSAPIKPVFTFTNLSKFSAGTDANQVKGNTAVNSFGSQPLQQQQQPSNSEAFVFKPSTPSFSFTQKKLEPATAPFQFGSASTNHTNNFNSTAPSTNQFNSTFGTAASSPFTTQGSIFGSSAPQPAQTASFLFGASQANDRPPPAPAFNFAAQGGSSAANSVGNTAVAGGFAFGQTQNSTPVQPPAFDPNVKPVFNFSGGQTPIFSATPAPASDTGEERKIRKAFRRTTQK